MKENAKFLKLNEKYLELERKFNEAKELIVKEQTDKQILEMKMANAVRGDTNQRGSDNPRGRGRHTPICTMLNTFFTLILA
jgi:hypothetical protein